MQAFWTISVEQRMTINPKRPLSVDFSEVVEIQLSHKGLKPLVPKERW
jgi:hypothetical protein